MSDLDLQAQIDELFLLQRVAQRISALLEMEVLLEEVVGDVAQTFGYSRCGVLLTDEASNDLVIAAVRGWTVNYHQKGERFKIGGYGIVGHVGATAEMHYAPDVLLDPYYQVSEPLTRSELDIPLKRHGRLIGILTYKVRWWTDFLLRAFAYSKPLLATWQLPWRTQNCSADGGRKRSACESNWKKPNSSNANCCRRATSCAQQFQYPGPVYPAVP